MPNWSNCVTVFRGKEEVIEEIAKNIKENGFSWGKTKRPKILDSYIVPAIIVSSEEWKKKIKNHEIIFDGLLRYMKQSVNDRLIKKYCVNDWYNWSIMNWGTKWNVDSDECAIIINNIGNGMAELLFMYDGAWSGGSVFFITVCEEYGLSGEYVDTEGGNDFTQVIYCEEGKVTKNIETQQINSETKEDLIKAFGKDYVDSIEKYCCEDEY